MIATINAAALSEYVEATDALVTLAEQYAQQLAARELLGGVSHDEALAAEVSAASVAATLPGLRAQAAGGAPCTGGAARPIAGSGPATAATRKSACAR